MTEIRLTKKEDLGEVMEIYESAQKFMCESGNPNQWAVGNPPRSLIEKDIEKAIHYSCFVDGRIECVFMYTEEPDPTYKKIYNGEWPNALPYGTMHRIASAGRVKRIADICLSWCFEQCKNLRADTHEDNKIMQNVLKRNGFEYCGIIYLLSGSERLAYQKTDKENTL